MFDRFQGSREVIEAGAAAPRSDEVLPVCPAVSALVEGAFRAA